MTDMLDDRDSVLMSTESAIISLVLGMGSTGIFSRWLLCFNFTLDQLNIEGTAFQFKRLLVLKSVLTKWSEHNLYVR